MSGMHLAKRAILVHAADKSCTQASAGALYALCIAAQPALETTDWVEIHNALMKRFNPADVRSWVRQLDKIKANGWRLHDAIANSLENQT